MTAIRSGLDVRGEEFRANAARLRALVDDLREKTATVARGGSDEARRKHLDRGKLLARDRVDALVDPGSAVLELSPLAAYGMYGGDVPSAGIVTCIGRIAGRRMRDRRQRRHGQGRHLLSDYGQKASARAGDRAAEPPAVHLSGRLRRGLPPGAGRGVSRPRAFRPDLLQPGEHVGAGDPADRRRDGIVHRRRRVRPGDVGRDGDRRQPGHDLSRRPAAGQGRDWRRGERGGAGRRGRPYAHLRRRGSPGGERFARAAPCPAHRGQAERRQVDRARRCAHRRAVPTTRRRSTA